MNGQLVFKIQGSEPEPYTVQVSKSGDNLRLHCDCAAGSKGVHCKHRYRLVVGETEGIVSDNAHEVQTVQVWYVGSDVEREVSRLLQLEAKLEEVKKEIAQARKIVARVMTD